MGSAHRQSDLKFLLGGVALLVSGLVFTGSSLGLYDLRSDFTHGFLALLACAGFSIAARHQPNMKWAWVPALLFGLLAARWLLASFQPGASIMPTLINWGLAVGFLAFFPPNPKRWWPIIPAGVLFFTGVQIGYEQLRIPWGPDEPIFILGGIALTFLAVHLISRKNTWALIVAGIMGLITAGMTAEWLLPGSDLGGAMVAFLMGLVFIAIHIRKRQVWWPVIPGGILCLIPITVHIDETLGFGEPWGVCFFFLGVAAIFGYLYLISNETNRLAWARYPAIALACVGVFALVVDGGGFIFRGILLPLGLLVAGVIYIIRALRARDRE
jgi:hypothetical protein